MLAMAEVGPGARVLDVAAGAGDQTLDIAKRVGPTGSASQPICRRQSWSSRRKKHGAPATVMSRRRPRTAKSEGHGGQLRCGDLPAGPDVLPRPGKGLREMFRALKPGGRACTMVFSTPDKNPCVTILLSTAFKHAGLPPRDPYQPGGLLSLGKPGLIDELFRQAGFSHVATTKVMAPFRLPSVKNYLDFVRTSASPIVQILGRLDDAARKAAWAEIESKLSGSIRPTGWEGPNELLLTMGRRP